MQRSRGNNITGFVDARTPAAAARSPKADRDRFRRF
eukprot:SAG31_NODE_6276_length_2092_cov_6.520321_3_plen_35_part_01